MWGKYYYHVSDIPVNDLSPRVPRHRLPYEDDATPRICFAPTIEQCVNAKPDAAEPIVRELERGRKFLLYAYVIDIDEYEGDEIVTGEVLEDSHGVLDWAETEELWLLRSPVSLVEQVWEVYDIHCRQDDIYAVEDLFMRMVSETQLF